MARQSETIRNELTDFGIQMDLEAFDNVVGSQGVRFVHFKSMACPVGLVDLFDGRRPHDDHSGCSNGFIYIEAGKILALSTGVGNNPQQLDIGLLDGSTSQITVQRRYLESDKLVSLLPYDRLFLDEESITVGTWERFEAHQTGLDKLRFPATEIEMVMDSDGVVYSPGDYRIEGGKLRWAGSRRPKFNLEAEKGQICSVRYQYRPYWYVSRLMHEIRVSAATAADGGLFMDRANQAALIQREHVFESAGGDDSMVASDPRQPRQPADGGFGPR